MSPEQALIVAAEVGISERLLRYKRICAARGDCRREALAGGGWTFCADCLTVYDHHGVSNNPIPTVHRNDDPLRLEERAQQRVLSVSPIYARTAGGTFHAVGSSIFISHGGKAFVVTASHVLREFIDAGELVTGGASTVRINQRYFCSIDEDRYDVGFIPLTPEQCSILSDIQFLRLQDVDCSEESSESLHYAVGYRADDNSQDEPSEQLNAAWSVYGLRSAPRTTYGDRQVSPANRLLLKFNRHRLQGPNGPVDEEPEPEGLSGAGVWRVFDPEDLSADRLTAIIESHTDSGRLIYATRLRILFSSLDEYLAGRLS